MTNKVSYRFHDTKKKNSDGQSAKSGVTAKLHHRNCKFISQRREIKLHFRINMLPKSMKTAVCVKNNKFLTYK